MKVPTGNYFVSITGRHYDDSTENDIFVDISMVKFIWRLSGNLICHVFLSIKASEDLQSSL